MLLFLLIFAHLFSRIRGEYQIKDGQVPSYLYKKFDDTKEEVFPYEIRISISLTKVSGTLFYSIDRLKNQLILSLSDLTEPTLAIEFGRQNYDLSLPQLCGCRSCRYEQLDLRIQMSHTMNIQCNGGIWQMRAYNRTKLFNENYPIPFSKDDFSTMSTNTAHVWLVNNPTLKDVYPNQEQLSGCIFDVWYRNEPVIFTSVSDNIDKVCTKMCLNDVCNDGQCLETYQKKPICNCTTAFLIGPYCSDTIYPMNIKSLNSKFQLNMFKLSWMSSSNQILTLATSHLQLQLSRQDRTLMMVIDMQIGSVAKSILIQSYVPNTKYTLIAYFEETIINVKILNLGVWYHAIVMTNRDMRKEIFTSITLQSDEGIISLAFKSSTKEYNWNNLSIPEYKQLEYVKVKNGTTIHTTTTKNTSLIALIILFIVVPVSIGMGIYFWRRQKRKNNKDLIHHVDPPVLTGSIQGTSPSNIAGGRLEEIPLLPPNEEIDGNSKKSDDSLDRYGGFVSLAGRPESSSDEETDPILGAKNNVEVPVNEEKCGSPRQRYVSVKGRPFRSDQNGNLVPLQRRPKSSSDEETDPILGAKRQRYVSVKGRPDGLDLHRKSGLLEILEEVLTPKERQGEGPCPTLVEDSESDLKGE